MFDFFLINNFNITKPINKLNISFHSLPFYNDVKKIEYNLAFDHTQIIYLEREKTEQNYFTDGSEHIFIYGSVFTNNQYQNEKGIKPHLLNAKEVSFLYKEFNLKLTQYIKGSFVIVIYKNDKIILLSDRLNVLPLYYYFKDDTLIISSAIKLILKTDYPSNSLDKASLVQQLIFDYMLDDFSLYKDIKRIKPGSIYTFEAHSCHIDKYWDVKNLYHDNLIPRTDSLNLLAEQLFENVQLYTSDKDKVLVSLTGGFDGRTNLAMLRKDKDDYLCYSYGMPGSRQISVPLEISEKLNIPYKPIYCDEDFVSQYINLGLKVTEFSNGSAPYTQAVLPYAYEQLSDFSDTILTGLFGSEVLRPLHNLGIIINDYSERIFLSDDPESEINTVLNELSKLNLLNSAIIGEVRDAVIEHFIKNYIERFREYNKVIRFFLFVIEEGIRKYFSQEIQSERVYVTNRFPYFDDDFIELIYKSTYAGMYNGFLGKSKFKRRKGQLLYAEIFKKYFYELADIKLDRGYKPKDLLIPFPLNYLLIGKAVYRTKKYNAKVGNDTFNTPKWSKSYINFSREEFSEDNYFNSHLISDEISKNEKQGLKRAHFLSLYNYTKNV